MVPLRGRGLIAAWGLAVSVCQAAAPSKIDGIVYPHLEALHKAGDADRCDPEVDRVRAAIRDDRRLSDEEIRAEIETRKATFKGRMPYPTKGTACAIFGIITALEGALKERGEAMKRATEEQHSFAPWRRGGGFVYVSGVRALDDKGALIAGDIKAQTKRALERLDEGLKAGGSSLAMAASVNVYLKDAGDFEAMNEVYRTFWAKDPPARTTVGARGADPAALIEVTAVGIATGGERKVVHPPGWLASPRPYSYGILSGDTLFASGLISRSGTDNQFVPGDIKAQVATVLGNGGEILKAAGLSHADVVQSRLYIPDTSLFQDMNSAYRAFFAKDPPARATVKATLTSPQYLFESTMTAVKGAREAITAPNADGSPGTPNPNLSSAVRAGSRLWVSGMLGNNDATKDDAAAQTRETLTRLGRTLEAAGFSWPDVREAIVYVSDLKHRPAVEKVWNEHFPGEKPAGVLVEMPLVAPDGLVEIMLTAARD
jgi:2-iminobutanoate/2-iminopropanoate deaminase